MIIGGAPIRNYAAVRRYLRNGDFIICCDSGLMHRGGLGVVPDLIIGDFDSAEEPHLPVETIVLPRQKDDTDTMAAVREAVRRGFDDFLLLGVFGARMDHSLANIYILTWLDRQGKKGLAVDDFSDYEIIRQEPAFIEPDYPYFSLLAVGGNAKGVTIRNALYPLENALITYEWQYAVSNEPLRGKTAEVSLTDGILLLIRDRGQ